MLLILTALLLVIGSVTYLATRSSGSSGTSRQQNSTAVFASRISVVNDPEVRVIPAGVSFSALDILRSAPSNAANRFDTHFLGYTQPRPMKSIDGDLYYVGEVANHSTDHTAIAPVLGVALLKNHRVVETTDLNFSDLPPGGHSPAYFSWGGSTTDIDQIRLVWKPVQGFATATPNHSRLETTITDRKLTPGTVTVNFTYTYHYSSAEVHGTVTNHGDASATGVQLYVTLYDAKGNVTGFKEKDLNELAPGQTTSYEISADQWDAPVASIDAEALATTKPLLP